MRQYTYFFDEYTKERSKSDYLGYLLKYSLLILAGAVLIETFEEHRAVVNRS
jgi:hypothetical protein